MELHAERQEVRDQVIAYHGFLAHLQICIANKAAITAAQNEAEILEFLRNLRQQSPSLGDITSADLAQLSASERDLVALFCP